MTTMRLIQVLSMVARSRDAREVLAGGLTALADALSAGPGVMVGRFTHAPTGLFIGVAVEPGHACTVWVLHNDVRVSLKDIPKILGF